MSRYLLPFLLWACAEPSIDEGTAVGNLDARMRVTTAPADDLVSLSGVAMVSSVGLLGCDGVDRLLVSEVDLALDGGSALALPAGAWCGLSLAPSSPFVWEGESTDGFSLSVTLDVGTLTVHAPSAINIVDGLRLLWRLGGPRWLSAKDLGADDADVVIAPGDPDHDELVEQLRRDQRLVRDADDDGEVDDDEQELAEPEVEDTPPDTERDGRDNDGDGLIDEPDETEEDPNEDP